MNGELLYSSLSEIFYKESQSSYSFAIRAGFLSLQQIQLLGQNISFL